MEADHSQWHSSFRRYPYCFSNRDALLLLHKIKLQTPPWCVEVVGVFVVPALAFTRIRRLVKGDEDAMDDDGQVRLVNGTNELQGQVEVRLSVNNETQWGTVCGDSWGINDATVVCSQLGYGKAESAYTGQGNGDVALDGVSCAGLENSLLECPRNAYLNCNQLTTAWVTCALPDQYDLRLRFGKTDLEGRVEVYENSTWATVCDNWWGSTEATVACWQLGYGKATAAPRRSFFGQDTGDIVFGTVYCQGTENSLHACQRSSEYCSHFEQAGVVCSQPDVYDIRLINGSHWREGRVEVYVKGHWGTVCDHSWDLRDAIVVCRQLGFKSATAAPGSAYFGQGSGDIVLDKVACDGTESSLQYCPWYGDTFSCLHDQDAGVVCSNADLPEKYDVRLRGGDSDLEGRVEVYIIGAWATVCDHGWDITDATVVCQQLGHTGALSANSSAAFGQGTGNIVFDKVACKGTENRLHDCPLDTTNNCSHSQDAGVVCKPPELYDLRLMSGSNAMEGRVEMYKDDSWETVCDYDWTITDATVACWQLGYTKAISAHKSAYFGQGSGELARTIGWECTGAESTLEDCTMSMYWPPCRHSEDVGVVCGVEEFAEKGSLRLMDGTTQYGGRVEIYLNGRWGTIYHNAWQFEEVDVVCKQLGYGHATSFNRDYTKMGTGAILIFSVLCNGKESRLTDCRYRSADPLRCTHIGDAGVTCSAPESGIAADLPPMNRYLMLPLLTF
ncbi:deleted in malignant brain tumors 1 protein-like [Patiria miniata]|uniref:SRCR domain-containing protein n=1 Tax=Patiria miniata TaxID=46514 RepID=A0A914A9I6_PATMI|nr:deleted in malignant brain tumors 1 protein-like [Patiria miniata]